MSKLVYGKNNQVRFENEAEKQEALRYLSTSENVKMVLENNQEQGAWASEKRFHFKSENGIPECLMRNMTPGRGSLFGRINCGELYDEVMALK